MANGRPTFSDVTCAELLSAAHIEAEIDDRLAGPLVEARLRVGQILALHHDPLLHRERSAARCCIGNDLDLVGGSPGSATRRNSSLAVVPDHFLSLSCPAGPALRSARGSAPCRWMMVSLVPIASMRRLQHFDRLLDRAADLVGDRRVGQRQPDAVVGLRHVEACGRFRRQARRRSAGSAIARVPAPWRARPDRRCGRTTARGSAPMPPEIAILPSRSFCRTSSRSASTWP